MKSLLPDRNPAQRKGTGSDAVVIQCCGTVALRPQGVNRRSWFAPGDAAVWMTAIVLSVLATNPSSGQTREVIPESRVRELARQAARDRRGASTDLVLELDRRVRSRWGDFESFPLSIVEGEDLLVTLVAPYLSYRNSLVDMLRSGRPIDQAVWTSMVVVEIAPRRLSAADIESVVLSRDGQTIASLKNAVRPMSFSNGTGEERMIHAGEVGFAPSAFSPGAHVVLTLTPHDGPAIVYVFNDDELTTLR
jgi:hypothetical protein